MHALPSLPVISSLADNELLAMVLGPGTRKNQPAASAATELVRSAGNGSIATLSRATPRELAQIVGTSRAERVAAAFELGRRAVLAACHRDTMAKPEDIHRVCLPRITGLAQEIFLVIGIDVRNGLLDLVEVARGTAIGVEVHPREVFRPLIRMSAAAGVLVHNHPSGDPTPSAEDIDLTRRLREIGQLVGIPIIDHVVVAQHGFQSIAEWLGTDIDRVDA
jgi:DNA repair protein RadC